MTIALPSRADPAISRRSRISRLRGGALRISAFSAVLALAGCADPNFGNSPPNDTIQYRTVPVSRSWVHAPEALIVVERNLGEALEQRIALPNNTTLSGENFMLARTRTSAGIQSARFQLGQFMTALGEVPRPFRDFSDSNLNTGEDELGPYFYSEENMGPGLNCVLAVRSVTSAERPLPSGASSLDLLLRNCARGTTQDALAPIMADRVRGRATSPLDVRRPGLRNLSPLAAPQM